MKSARPAFPFLAAFSVFALACGGEAGVRDEEVTTAQEPIINGAVISQTASGVVMLGNGCSGTLITNTKVLTAKHCVTQYQTNPGTLAIFMAWQTSSASQIWTHPDSHVDAAVIWLTYPISMNGSTTGYRRDITMVTADQLNGGALVIDGYGDNTASGGAGILRRGVCSTKKRATGLESCFPAGNPPTIQSWGDSGGPGSVYTTGLPVVYIQSGCFFGSNGIPTECYGNTSDSWGNWAWWYLL